MRLVLLWTALCLLWVGVGASIFTGVPRRFLRVLLSKGALQSTSVRSKFVLCFVPVQVHETSVCVSNSDPGPTGSLCKIPPTRQLLGYHRFILTMFWRRHRLGKATLGYGCFQESRL